VVVEGEEWLRVEMWSWRREAQRDNWEKGGALIDEWKYLAWQ